MLANRILKPSVNKKSETDVQNSQVIYPEKIPLSRGAKEGCYAKQCECRNCGHFYWWIDIPKGVTVEEYRKDLTCKVCDIKGDFLIW